MQQKNKIRCHSKLDLESSTLAVLQQQQQRPAWKILKQVQDDGLICYNNNGFTLIELLVVVLIIGILAAVAVPQYQKAVWKSRNIQLKTLVKSVGQARDAYYIANGSYPTNFSEMDIDLPLTPANNAAPYFNTTDNDSIRKGKDFLIGISGSSIVGIWTSGPYEAAGFRILPNKEINCTERKFHNGTNKFCGPLERGTNRSDSDYWYYYDLP